MRRYALVIALVAAPAAFAQVHVELNVPLPTVRFDVAPPLMVVEPGVQVVPAHNEEVFFVQGHYWTRHGEHWFRTQDWRGGWIAVEPRVVPVSLVRIPVGRYRQWHAATARPPEVRQEVREHEREERREERHEEHERKREERREWKAERRAEHEENRERGHERHEDRREGEHRGHDRHDDDRRRDDH